MNEKKVKEKVADTVYAYDFAPSRTFKISFLPVVRTIRNNVNSFIIRPDFTRCEKSEKNITYNFIGYSMEE